MNQWLDQFEDLKSNPKTWLVTGVAGFIGSNLLEHLLILGQKVIGLDNFSMGFQHNLDLVRRAVGSEVYDSHFSMLDGDIRNQQDCVKACSGADYVLHQAAVGSVPKSIEDPQRTHSNNVDGFVNMLVAAKDAGVKTFVYASSSSVYGDTKVLPQVEPETGRLLSPYAASKKTNESYAQAFANCYEINPIGLRYFNVFGPRQNPQGAYAAVIPKWIDSCLKNEPCTINGDGKIYRDFTHVENVVLANLLAATTKDISGEVFNAALGGAITLTDLHSEIAKNVADLSGNQPGTPIYGPGRKGDIITSSSDSSKIRDILGFKEVVGFQEGVTKTVQWYMDQNPSE